MRDCGWMTWPPAPSLSHLWYGKNSYSYLTGSLWDQMRHLMQNAFYLPATWVQREATVWSGPQPSWQVHPSISITWVLVTPGLHPRPTEPESLGICVLTNFPGDFYALRFEKHDSIITDKPEVIRSILSVRVKHLGRGKSVELLLAECLRQIPASPEAVTRLMRAPHPMPQRTLQHIKQRESGRECYSHRHICNRVF